MTLALQAVSFGHRQRRIGSGITLSVEKGEVLALMGANGAGKTTLFKTMLGLLPVQAGEVLLEGKPLSDWSRRERAQRIAYVPQAHAALFPFTVLDIVLMGRTAHMASFSAPTGPDRTIALEALAGLGIAHLSDSAYTEISGGEQQLALVARALAQQPAILVMDEPSASLDYGNQMRLFSHIRQLASRGIAIILSAHNPDHVFIVADRVAVLHDGRIAGLGPPKYVLTPAMLKTLYDIDVVIGSIDGSAARVCAPQLNSKTDGGTNGS